MVDNNNMEKLNSIIDRFIDTDLKFSPVKATHLGIHDYDDKLGSLSKENIYLNLNMTKNIYHELKLIDYDGLSLSSKVDYDTLAQQLDIHIHSIEKEKYYDKSPSLYQKYGVNAIFPMVIKDFAPLKQRQENILSRMTQISEIMEQGKENLKNPPQLWTEMAISENSHLQNFFNQTLLKFFKDSELKEKYLKLKEPVIDSLKNYKDFLEKDLLPISTGDWAAGKETFDFILKTVYMLDRTPEEIYQTGKEVFEQTEQELEEYATTVYNKTWKELDEYVKQQHPKPEDLLNTYQEAINKVRSFVVEQQLVDIPENDILEVMETPEFNRISLPFAGYQPPPPYEKKEKAIFWVTPIDKTLPPEKREEILRWHNFGSIQFVSLHEAYPGHHLQLLYANSNPSRLRKYAMNTLFIEGWALYTEKLMREYDYYDKLGRFSQIKARLWRASRVIVDVGIHTGMMNFDDGVEFLVNKTNCDRWEAIAQMKYYTQLAGQPMSYLIGMLEILKLREEYKKLSGDKFSLREFHNKLLSYGSLPIKFISKLLL